MNRTEMTHIFDFVFKNTRMKCSLRYVWDCLLDEKVVTLLYG